MPVEKRSWSLGKRLKWKIVEWLFDGKVPVLVEGDPYVNLPSNVELRMAGSPGSAGQFLRSRGAGQCPEWASIGSGTTNKLVKWTGSGTIGDSVITDVGTYVEIPGNVELRVAGSAGSSGQFLRSRGSGQSPQWFTLGRGTANRLVKWIGSDTIGNSAITDGGTYVDIPSSVELRVAGSAGSSGQFLRSRGSGQSPQWFTLGTGTANRLVKWTGSDTIGNSAITDGGTYVEIPSNVELRVAGSVGSAGQVLKSRGAGQSPVWADFFQS